MTTQDLLNLLQLYLDTEGDHVIQCGIEIEDSQCILWPIANVRAINADDKPQCMLELGESNAT